MSVTATMQSQLQALETNPAFIQNHEIRAKFTEKMSAMYGEEVPLYKELVEAVKDVNREYIAAHPGIEKEIGTDLEHISKERHGAIRLGTAKELSTMADLFAIMGMQPIGYYDLSIAALPIHATSFCPIDDDSNAFRMFTSLLRTDLLPPDVAKQAEEILAKRNIFSDKLLELIQTHKKQGGLTQAQADLFIEEAMNTFRWHKEAVVSKEVYTSLLSINSLVADIVSFKGPHLNHLTPRVLDIYSLHQKLKSMGIAVIPEVQGPPGELPILLQQTSFRALTEDILFPDGKGGFEKGLHKARFGEVESRNTAITPEAMKLYEKLIAEVSKWAVRFKTEMGMERYEREYPRELRRIFNTGWPAKNLEELRQQKLGYFTYEVAENKKNQALEAAQSLDTSGDVLDVMDRLVNLGVVQAHPITYQVFLPASAAGIFKSNLEKEVGTSEHVDPNQDMFEKQLGRKTLNHFDITAAQQAASIRDVANELGLKLSHTQKLDLSRIIANDPVKNLASTKGLGG